jgi:hypothetical protein
MSLNEATARFVESRAITPKDLRYVRIVPSGTRYEVRTSIGFASFGPQSKKVLLNDKDAKTEGLTRTQAEKVGRRLEKAIAAIEGVLRKGRKK